MVLVVFKSILEFLLFILQGSALADLWCDGRYLGPLGRN